jgi:hypothetical protein
LFWQHELISAGRLTEDTTSFSRFLMDLPTKQLSGALNTISVMQASNSEQQSKPTQAHFSLVGTNYKGVHWNSFPFYKHEDHRQI